MSGSNIDNVISCAVNYASDNHHEYVTLEHLTLCLLEDDNIPWSIISPMELGTEYPSKSLIFKNCTVDKEVQIS